MSAGLRFYSVLQEDLGLHRIPGVEEPLGKTWRPLLKIAA